MTVTDDQNRAAGDPEFAELPEDVQIATEEGRKLAEQLRDSRPHARKLLEVRNLSTRFSTREGIVHAVDDVSFAVRAGEIVGLIGPNGAGKSTLFNLLTRTLPMSAGRIEFLGRDVSALSQRGLARLGMARTFQHVKPLCRKFKSDILVASAEHLSLRVFIVSPLMR